MRRRILKGLAAIATMTVPALMLTAAPAGASTTLPAATDASSYPSEFYLCNTYESNNPCFPDYPVLGQQLILDQAGWDPFVAVEYAGGTPSWYYIVDDVTGWCLKADPSVGNIVVEETCATSGHTLAEELWSNPFPTSTASQYNIENYYYWENDESDIDLHADTSNGYANVYQSGEKGDSWTLCTSNC